MNIIHVSICLVMQVFSDFTAIKAVCINRNICLEGRLEGSCSDLLDTILHRQTTENVYRKG